MHSLLARIKSSPTLIRVVPFAIFLLLTFCQGQFGEAGRYWFYLAKTLVGAWMLWIMWPLVTEMRWQLSGAAILVGVGVFALWVGLDEIFRQLGFAQAPRFKTSETPWNPNTFFGAGSFLAWFFILVHILGSSIVVPPLEEAFYRSWLYRYLKRPDFLSVPLGGFYPFPFIFTSVIFGFEHREWLAGILCGFAFQGLVCWKKRLSDAVTAHSITNFLLGIWVVWKGAWLFW